MKLICWGKSTAAVSLSIRFYTLAQLISCLVSVLNLIIFFTQWLKLAYYTLMLITSKLLNWLLSITFHNNIDFSSGYWITDVIKGNLGTAELNFLLNSMFSWPFCLGSTESTQWGRLCCPHFTPHLFPLVRHARSYEIFTKLKVPEKRYLFVLFCAVCHIKELDIKKTVQHCSFVWAVLNLVSNVWQDKLAIVAF